MGRRPGIASQGPRPAAVNAASFVLLIVIGWLDYVTGYELGFFIFYFIPVSITAWFVGRRSGVFMAFAAAASWFISDKLDRHPYPNAYFIYWEMFMRYLSFLTTALTVAKIRAMLLNEERLNAELQAALRELRELKAEGASGGGLPVMTGASPDRQAGPPLQDN